MAAAPRLSFARINGFPDDFSENGKIETLKFLEASREVVGIIESFGAFFSPIVSDMRGNVDQLEAYYEKDTKSRYYIEDMILSDEMKMSHPWLLWLKRALQLIERFFYYVLQSEDVVKGKSDDLRPMINQAYTEVLKPYHGFLLQNTFRLLNRCLPSRKTLLGTEAHLDENIKHLQILMPKMHKHIEKIDKFYDEHNLNDSRKV